MSCSKKLIDFLKEKKVNYEVIPHTVSYTAQETAASVHVSGKEVVKAVIVTDGREYVMAVVDAPHRIDLIKFAELSGMNEPWLAGESEFRQLFPDCEPGAMPPFGNLYGLKVFVDKRLEEDESITFNAGSHFEAVKMKFEDFKQLSQPEIGAFSA